MKPPLYIALEEMDTEAMRLLIDKGAIISSNSEFLRLSLLETLFQINRSHPKRVECFSLLVPQICALGHQGNIAELMLQLADKTLYNVLDKFCEENLPTLLPISIVQYATLDLSRTKHLILKLQFGPYAANEKQRTEILFTLKLFAPAMYKHLLATGMIPPITANIENTGFINHDTNLDKCAHLFYNLVNKHNHVTGTAYFILIAWKHPEFRDKINFEELQNTPIWPQVQKLLSFLIAQDKDNILKLFQSRSNYFKLLSSLNEQKLGLEFQITLCLWDDFDITLNANQHNHYSLYLGDCFFLAHDFEQVRQYQGALSALLKRNHTTETIIMDETSKQKEEFQKLSKEAKNKKIAELFEKALTSPNFEELLSSIDFCKANRFYIDQAIIISNLIIFNRMDFLEKYLELEKQACNAPNNLKQTPLYVAAEKRHIEAVALLLKEGGKLVTDDKFILVALFNLYLKGDTYEEDLEIFKLLLPHIFSSNLQDEVILHLLAYDKEPLFTILCEYYEKNHDALLPIQVAKIITETSSISIRIPDFARFINVYNNHYATTILLACKLLNPEDCDETFSCISLIKLIRSLPKPSLARYTELFEKLVKENGDVDAALYFAFLSKEWPGLAENIDFSITPRVGFKDELEKKLSVTLANDKDSVQELLLSRDNYIVLKKGVNYLSYNGQYNACTCVFNFNEDLQIKLKLTEIQTAKTVVLAIGFNIFRPSDFTSLREYQDCLSGILRENPSYKEADDRLEQAESFTQSLVIYPLKTRQGI